MIIPGLSEIQYLALAMLGLLALLWLLFEASSSPPSRKHLKEKERMFACGMEMEPEDMNVPQESYFASANRFLRTDLVGRLHTGRLSDYTILIIIGTAIIMAALMIL